MNLQELGRLLNLPVQGEPDYEIHGVRDIERLSEEQPLEEHFVYFIESKAVLKRHPKAAVSGAVLTTPALAGEVRRALVVEGDARLAFIRLLQAFDKAPRFAPGVSPDAVVDPTASIGEGACVLAGAVVMAEARVGARCVLHPGVVLEPHAEVGEDTVLHAGASVGHHCVVGRRCVVHGGVVIGADGFGFYDEKGGRHKIPQIGNVVVGDDVEIGATSTIDRATIESTTIGDFTKLDDQVHIGHNCRLGRYIYIAGKTGLAGSVVLEDGVMISGMVSIKDHLRLAKGSIVMGMSGLAQDTEPGMAYFGIPARPAREMHKMNAALSKLPGLLSKLRHLES
ncbi:MAG: UDP-3-O-(3-hydroxymyristoyl)glucosamine N-acyltransferase [Elusimicrobiota bacterium]|jgi:UDP-3-O-[3-hydroxymyristoyl] glucosamine N-acyltransferase